MSALLEAVRIAELRLRQLATALFIGSLTTAATSFFLLALEPRIAVSAILTVLLAVLAQRSGRRSRMALIVSGALHLLLAGLIVQRGLDLPMPLLPFGIAAHALFGLVAVLGLRALNRLDAAEVDAARPIPISAVTMPGPAVPLPFPPTPVPIKLERAEAAMAPNLAPKLAPNLPFEPAAETAFEPEAVLTVVTSHPFLELGAVPDPDSLSEPESSSASRPEAAESWQEPLVGPQATAEFDSGAADADAATQVAVEEIVEPIVEASVESMPPPMLDATAEPAQPQLPPMETPAGPTIELLEQPEPPTLSAPEPAAAMPMELPELAKDSIVAMREAPETLADATPVASIDASAQVSEPEPAHSAESESSATTTPAPVAATASEIEPASKTTAELHAEPDPVQPAELQSTLVEQVAASNDLLEIPPLPVSAPVKKTAPPVSALSPTVTKAARPEPSAAPRMVERAGAPPSLPQAVLHVAKEVDSLGRIQCPRCRYRQVDTPFCVYCSFDLDKYWAASQRARELEARLGRSPPSH